jgi:tRNA A-37 threonylcarbamoyl transferase component Bud32
LAAADARLAGAFAAHQKLESMFALLRGEPDGDLCREPGTCASRVPWRSADDQPEHLGRYLIQSTLGTGAFGTVYLARDPELKRDVAIKVLRSALLDSPGMLDKFRTEARHAASLNHPGIVSIYDVGREGDRLFIVMQYVPGRTLEDVLAEGHLAPNRAAELLATVAEALHYAHKQSFVHRDLKPANILLDDHGEPHVADFGLAVSDETQRTLAGQIAGTPAYMSPEQVRGAAHHLDGRTDIWSLGVIGYELLTGRQPFWHGDAIACLDAIQHRDPKPPRQIDDTIPAELERIILKCLAKQPTDRYATAGDIATDLRRWQRSQIGGRHTLRRALIAAATLAAVSLAAFGWHAAGVPRATSSQPLTGTIDVRLWNPDNPARRGLTLGDPGALPLRIGDQVRVEASASQPSYVYIVWIGSDGNVHPVYPWRNGDWQDRDAEKPVTRLSIPEDQTLGWPMAGPPGAETLLFLVRETPMPRDVNVRELLRGLPDILIAEPETLVRLGEGQVNLRYATPRFRAPKFDDAQRIDDPALAAERFLIDRFQSSFDLVAGLRFRVAGRVME